MSCLNAMLAAVGIGSILLAVSVGHAGPSTQGSGVMKTEARQVEPFTRIEIRGSADVDATIGQQPSLNVEAEDNILPLIDITVKDGTLIISSNHSYSTQKGVKVRIVVASLRGISIVGSGDVSVAGVKEPRFEVNIKGSGDVKLDGSADDLSVNVAGSGDVDTLALAAKRADVNVRGSGDVKVRADQSLQASLAGSGDIRYAGNPQQVTKDIRGQGSVKPL